MTTKEKVKRIQCATGFKVNSYKIITKGSENLIIEVNKKWIFRFPKNPVLREKTKERLDFLVSFAKSSPLKVPEPKFIEKDFIGYKKITGEPFYLSNLKKLKDRERIKIAKQLGLFLKALHGHKDIHVNFDTGYLVMRKNDYEICPSEIVKYLDAKKQEILSAKIEAIKNNALNFKKPVCIIHGDLHFNNILWDPKKKCITGVIDWGELGLGMPAMDFIMLADFNNSSNNRFLRDVLRYYGDTGDSLFLQIKENAIIDIMNWFWSYYKENNRNGMDRIIRKLKKILI